MPAGQTTIVFVYRSWDGKSCTSMFGVVKVSVKPQHGKLTNRIIEATIPGVHRFGTSGQCSGQSTKGFAVFYTPASGFRGTDTFTLDISWPHSGRQATDTFAVTVRLVARQMSSSGGPVQPRPRRLPKGGASPLP